jgi:hypothetical protein
MGIIRTGIMCLLAAGISFSAVAQEKKAPRKSLHDEFTGQGYGVAGCGLGSIVFGAKPGMIQVVAATLNGWGGQTFAISTGTSNCDIPESGQQAAVFIEVNKEIVRKEAARGEGETIKALAGILNCGSEQDLGAELKGQYDRYFGKDVDTYETVRRIINSGTCSKG